ncbi:MAG: hypothetical protein B6D56_01275 [Candidatus Omnitrophica bacterium 4484_70.1]|nr:MAG: hypothetical protein B6D56_01275 [Candidatus Omnitrophica bacterium 4484_70.1]
MNSLIIVGVAGILFGWGFFVYARYIEKILEVNPKEKPPAVTEYDGVDFIPAKNWLVLFGHHFSSIAGAAPIVGPVIAVSIWGWFPSLIWIVLGSILIGGVHDFSSLMVSVKNKGRSIVDIAKGVLSYRAKIVFSIFILLALILVIAVFAYLCAKTFVTDTRVILPSLGLIPIAMVVGFLLYKTKLHQSIPTLIGLVSLLLLLFLSNLFPVNLGKMSLERWVIILVVYAFFASCLPVNILLQPRDYLSAYLLFFGIGIGYLGLIISHPHINLPPVITSQYQFNPLWPMLFVTIACGAVSGFHSLIASGTTSKQLSNQKYGRRIGYGGMVFEGILAVLALLCVASGFKNYAAFKAIFKSAGPIGSFSKGFGNITSPLLGNVGALVGVIILNAFILTTLDTATRIARYIAEELTGIKNRWVSTFMVIIPATYLALGGRWKLIWPTFGASNQLVAALALLVITSWLLSKGKSFLFTFLPGLFMLTTTTFALLFQIFKYWKGKQILLLSISLIILVLSLYILFEMVNLLRKKTRTT